jgi:hypothetical protein
MKFVQNTADNLHCTQASLIMLVDSLTGVRMTMDEADHATGFTPDVETWPYAMLRWLAENGFEVVHIDALDAIALANDPLKELRRSGLDKATIDYFFEISDFEDEARSIQAAVAAGVSFVSRIPTFSDLLDMFLGGWSALASLNAATLMTGGIERFDGHMVLCTNVTDDEVVMQDPGPPPLADFVVTRERFIAALRSPADSSGTLTFVRNRR